LVEANNEPINPVGAEIRADIGEDQTRELLQL
jgi:hypothetical protein